MVVSGMVDYNLFMGNGVLNLVVIDMLLNCVNSQVTFDVNDVK